MPACASTSSHAGMTVEHGTTLAWMLEHCVLHHSALAALWEHMQALLMAYAQRGALN